MSKRGQRIFKFIVWTAIIVFLIIAAVGLVRKAKHPPITENEWMEMLSRGFDDQGITAYAMPSDGKLEGRYAAVTALRAVGEEKLRGIAPELGDMSDDELIDLALETGVIKEDQLSKELSQEEANEVMLNAMDLCFDPEYYPEYFEAEFTKEINDTQSWDVQEFDTESMVMTASMEEAPEPGEVVIYRDEFGIAYAAYADSVSETQEGVYSMELSPVEDVSEIMDSISFSGSADFSYLSGARDVDSNGAVSGAGDAAEGYVSAVDGALIPGPLSGTRQQGTVDVGKELTASPFILTAYADEPGDSDQEDIDEFRDESSEKVDIKINSLIESGIKAEDGKGSAELKIKSAISMKQGLEETTYEFGIGDDGEPYFEPSVKVDLGPGFDDQVLSMGVNVSSKKDKDKKDNEADAGSTEEFGAEGQTEAQDSDQTGTGSVETEEGASSDAEGSKAEEPEKNQEKEPTKNSEKLGMSVSVGAEIKGLSICTSGEYHFFDWRDRNYVEIMVKADEIKLSSSAKLEAESKYLIGSFPVPIAITGGTISVNLKLYLVVSASGELSLWYTIEEPYVGVNISAADGLSVPRGFKGNDSGAELNLELSAGSIIEVEIEALGRFKLIAPQLDIRAYADASSSTEIADGYELKEGYEANCMEVKLQAPIIVLKATAEETIAADLLEKLSVGYTFNIIEKDSDAVLLKKRYHAETEKDGSVQMIEMDEDDKDEDVCTHIQLKPVEEETEETDTSQDLEDMLDGMLGSDQFDAEQWLSDRLEAAINRWLEKNLSGCQ